MRTFLVVGFSTLLVAAIGLVPLGYRSLTSVEYRNLRVVDEGKLYRSGQMTPAGFVRVVREYKIGTVIALRDVRDDGKPAPEQNEIEYCATHGIDYYKMPPRPWSAPDGSVPNVENITKFLDIVDAPNTKRPILVHCFAGIHRTGGMCAVYRMEYQGWSPADASAEMQAMGTVRTTFADDLIGYVEGYVPRRRGGR